MNEYEIYLAGLVASDGTLRRKQLSIELNYKDCDILYNLQKYFVNAKISERKRTVKVFKDKEYNTHTVIFSLYDVKFIDYLSKKYNIPIGSKSKILEFPLLQEEEVSHYLRGIIDGDGSLGFTKNGKPFISLVTASDKFAKSYLEFINKKLNIFKTSSPNKRDKAYNITVLGEHAQQLVNILYNNSIIKMNRKFNTVQEILKWKRDVNLRKQSTPRKWDKKQDEFIMSHSTEESAKYLNRTITSIKVRKQRLKLTKAPFA